MGAGKTKRKSKGEVIQSRVTEEADIGKQGSGHGLKARASDEKKQVLRTALWSMTFQSSGDNKLVCSL